MLDWVTTSSSASIASVTVPVMLARLLMAALYGISVAGIYRVSHGRLRGNASILFATLVLLTILIAMVSMVIGDSVARAFSLVGALSIVRFRTVVEDTRDTAFVIFAVIVGMAAGAGSLVLPILGIPLVGAVAVLLSLQKDQSETAAGNLWEIKVRFGLGRDPESELATVFARYVASRRVVHIETTRQGASIDVTFRIRLQPEASLTALVAELNRTDGVQYVDVQIV